MHADIDECAERRHVCNDSRQAHPFLQIGNFVHAFLEREYFKLFARVASGFFKFLQNILQGRQADILGNIFFQINAGTQFPVGEQRGNVATQIRRHLFDERVAFRVHGGGVKRVFAVANAQKARALLKSFFAEARHFFQIFAGTERAVFVAVGDNVGGDARV